MEDLFEKILKNVETVKNKFGESVNIDSLMIEKDGKVFSKFFKEDGLHEMRSISKVLVALAYGILFDRKLMSPDDFVYPIIKNVSSIDSKENLSKIKKWQIKHLLTYSCGFESQMFSERFIKEIGPQTYLDYILNFNLVHKAGERYVYNNAEIFLLSVCYQEKFGENLKDFINREIFIPLEITNFAWQDYAKYCAGGTGLFLLHKDLFKLGKLILNKGEFEGKKIISKEFFEAACTSQIETPYAVKPERVLPKIGVGYVFHISRDGFVYKDGTNGQYLIFNFDKNLLITILSSEKDMSQVTEILRDLI